MFYRFFPQGLISLVLLWNKEGNYRLSPVDYLFMTIYPAMDSTLTKSRKLQNKRRLTLIGIAIEKEGILNSSIRFLTTTKKSLFIPRHTNSDVVFFFTRKQEMWRMVYIIYLRSEAEFRVSAFSTATTAGHVTSTTCVSGANKRKPWNYIVQIEKLGKLKLNKLLPWHIIIKSSFTQQIWYTRCTIMGQMKIRLPPHIK